MPRHSLRSRKSPGAWRAQPPAVSTSLASDVSSTIGTVQKRGQQVPADKRYAMAARLPKIALDFHATLNEPTRLEDFRSMSVPTLLLHGTSSPLPTQRICELLARILPEARLKTIGGAGHMAPVTHRDQVNAMVIAQLDSHSGQASQRAVVAETLSRTNAASSARSVA